jgi:sugar phosphate isomerase/epimerase
MRRRDFLAALLAAPYLTKEWVKGHGSEEAAMRPIRILARGESAGEVLSLGIVSDELDDDPAKAFALGRTLGLKRYSIRKLGSERIPCVPEAELCAVDDMLKSGQGTVVSISPGTNKVAFVEAELDRMVRVDLAKAVGLAHRWNCHSVNIFSWLKTTDATPPTKWNLSPSMPEGVVKGLKQMAELAESEDVLLCVETGYQTWADTGTAAAALLERVGSLRLKVLWDPSNSMAGRARWGLAPDAPERNDPTGCLLQELEAISGLLSEVHVRDITLGKEGYQWAPLGAGVIDWKRILVALIEKGFCGQLTIEHHQDNKPQAARHAVDYLCKLMAGLDDRPPV